MEADVDSLRLRAEQNRRNVQWTAQRRVLTYHEAWLSKMEATLHTLSEDDHAVVSKELSDAKTSKALAPIHHPNPRTPLPILIRPCV